MVKLASKTAEKISLTAHPCNSLTQQQLQQYSSFLKETDDFFHVCFKSNPEIFHKFAKTSSFKTLRNLLSENHSTLKTSKELNSNKNFIISQKHLLSKMLEKKSHFSETCQVFQSLLKILSSTCQSSKLSLRSRLSSLLHNK
jgi:hypothetical protein